MDLGPHFGRSSHTVVADTNELRDHSCGACERDDGHPGVTRRQCRGATAPDRGRRRTLMATIHTASSAAPIVPVHLVAPASPTTPRTRVTVISTVVTTAREAATRPCALNVRIAAPSSHPVVMPYPEAPRPKHETGHPTELA